MATYLVHNVTRGRHNRTLRAQQPVHHSVKQYLGGGTFRSIRGRPIVLNDESLQTHLEELKGKVATGIFEVRTADGRLVDLNTMEAVATPEVSPPLPNPPLDSIANDVQNVGEKMAQFPGGDAPQEDGTLPSLIAQAESEPPVTQPEESEEIEVEMEAPADTSSKKKGRK